MIKGVEKGAVTGEGTKFIDKRRAKERVEEGRKAVKHLRNLHASCKEKRLRHRTLLPMMSTKPNFGSPRKGMKQDPWVDCSCNSL